MSLFRFPLPSPPNHRLPITTRPHLFVNAAPSSSNIPGWLLPTMARDFAADRPRENIQNIW
ncbi:hypothetical protein GSI_07802 [Ganoderma sinense ZZ0214-1]|uniref:Uncharacterized protein n=1 Tax=Ganoderma sinense ZZ0214-1 TaxID=1077348 RepID=A0A2G8S8I9_9APHY|nr:hypothetical protein GSI_07631 [Ganoderma sinense ZZ0214-1]PIL30224.1 hypothetical protein GSI_07802 [Ganoderma sinense ZZ0214-1]